MASSTDAITSSGNTCKPKPAAPSGVPAYLLYCAVLFIPLAHMRFGYHTLYALELRRFVLILLVMLGGGLFIALSGRFWRRRHPIHRPVWVFVGATLVATAFSRVRPLSLEASAWILTGALLYYLAAFELDTEGDAPPDLERLRGAVGVSTAWVAAYSLAQHAGLNPLRLVAEGDHHHSVTFVTRNLLAAYLLFGALILLDGLLRDRRRWRVLADGVGVALALIALGLTVTLSAWAALLAALAGYAMVARRLTARGVATGIRARRLAVVLVLAIVVVVGVEARRPAAERWPAARKVGRLLRGHSASLRDREVMWRVAGRILLAPDQLLLGSGPGTYAIERPRHAASLLATPRYRAVRSLSVYAHDDVLHVAAEGGLASAIPFVALIVCGLLLPAWLLAKNDRTRAHLARVLPWWAGWLGLTLHGLTHFTLHAPAAGFYWWLALGLVAGCDLRGGRRAALRPGPRRTLARVGIGLGAVCVAGFCLLTFVGRYQQARGFAAWRLEATDGRRRAARRLERARLCQAAGDLTGAAALRREARQLAEQARRAVLAAEASYRLAARLRPWSARLWAQRGDLRRRQGRLTDALAEYHRGLRWSPDDPGLHHAIGMAHLEAEQLDRAHRYAVRTRALEPNEARGHCLVGLVALSRGDREAALAAFASAREVHPEDAGGYHWGALTLGLAGRSDDAMALLDVGLRRIGGPAADRSQLLFAHLMALFALQRDMPRVALQIWQATSRHYGGVATLDRLAGVARELAGRRRTDLRTETVHELLRLVDRRLQQLGPAAPGDRLGPLRVALPDRARAALEAYLAGQLEAGEQAAEQLLGALAEIDRVLASTLASLDGDPLGGLSGPAVQLRAGARLVRELLPEVTRALREGPLFPRPIEQLPREAIIRRLNRLAGLPRDQRRAARLHGPLYLAELRLVRARLTPGEDRFPAGERLTDDLGRLEAEALRLDGQLDAAAALLARLETIDPALRPTLLPPWAAALWDAAPPPARRYCEAARPASRALAQLARIELTLARGGHREAAEAAAGFTCPPAPRPPEGLAADPLVVATRQNHPARLARLLEALARLEAGSASAARDVLQRLEASDPALAAPIVAIREQLGRPTARQTLQRILDTQ